MKDPLMPASSLTPLKYIIKRIIKRLFSIWARADLPRLSSGTFLIIAPHPDDETLGCGALIAQARAQGRNVAVVVVTNGSASSESNRLTPQERAFLRRKETIKATSILGLNPEALTFLDHPDGEAKNNLERITQELGALIDALSPAAVFAPCGLDEHPDHRAVAQAMAACAPLRPSLVVFEYPMWFWGKQAFLYMFSPRLWRPYFKLDAGPVLSLKETAARAHLSQWENITDETSWKTLPASFLALCLEPYELFFFASYNRKHGHNRG